MLMHNRPRNLLSALPDLMDTLAEAQAWERELDLLRSYHGLGGGASGTWAELARERDFTPEWARQLGHRFRDRLGEVLLQGEREIQPGSTRSGAYPGGALPAWSTEEARALREWLLDLRFRSESQILLYLHHRYQEDLSELDRRHLRFLLDLFGWTSIEGTATGLDPDDRYWAEGSRSATSPGRVLARELPRVVRRARQILSAHPHGIHLEDFTTAMAESIDLELSRSHLTGIILQLPEIEEDSEERIYTRGIGPRGTDAPDAQPLGDPDAHLLGDLPELLLRDVGGVLDEEALWVEVVWHRPGVTRRQLARLIDQQSSRFRRLANGEIALADSGAVVEQSST